VSTKAQLVNPFATL